MAVDERSDLTVLFERIERLQLRADAKQRAGDSGRARPALGLP